MRGMPFNLEEGKGVLEALEGGGGGGFWFNHKRRKGFKEGREPKSVLDKRSPSPPTSTSTLSSSLGGGGGSSDTAGVAAVSDNPTTHKWPPSCGSTNTPSSSSAGAAEEGGATRKEEWASELQPIPMGLAGGEKCGLGGVEDWEAMLSDSAAAFPGQDQTFLRWIMADIEDPSSAAGGPKQQQLLPSQGSVELDSSTGGLGFGLVDAGFGFEPIGSSSAGGFPPINSSSNIKVPTYATQPNNPIFPSPPANTLSLPLSLPPGVFYHEPMEEKPLLFSPSLLLNQHQQLHASPNPSFFLPLPPFTTQLETQQQPPPHLLPSQPKRHQATTTDHFLPRNQAFPQLNAVPYQLQQRPSTMAKPKAAMDEAAAAHQQAVVDQLFKAAELVEAGNTVSARGILARLNHQLPSPSGKPLIRCAFYFKEALHHLSNNSNTHSPPPSCSPLATPLDVLLKLGTYKAFSEISPILQFTNFTCIQALLEELNGADRIHIIDFDVGVGGHWSSFMQELAQRRSASTGATPLLKITAFASVSSHHPLELHLTRENLSHFATDLNIPFEFNILSLESFDPSVLLAMSTGIDEAIAVNLPIGSGYHIPIPILLRLVKQLNPKIVVSVDHGCDRSDLPFSHHFLHAFQSCTVLLDSIDASGASSDVANKIERYLVQPRIEGSVLGRHRAVEKTVPWRTLFASAGFVPVQFSNFTETQAECLLKRVQVRGFQVEKRQASLFLCWQRGELVSVSAWRC